jgi:dTDP-glucose 4,6-dehydratase
MGAEIEIVSDQQRLRPDKSEVERLWADNSKARRLLDWQPSYGGLDGFRRGLSATVDWFTQSGQLSSYKSDVYNL